MNAKSDNAVMKRIALTALNNCLHSSVTGFYDILSVANLVAARQGAGHGPFDPVIVSPSGQPVTCFNGLTLTPHMGMAQCPAPDLIYLPVIYGGVEPLLTDGPLTTWLESCIRKDTLMTAVCAGVFVLAGTGVLDHREATTHWGLAREFSARFPRVRLKPEKMLVDEGNVITAGGVTAYMDLALYLIARFGSRQLAATVSKSLLIDPLRSTQTPYTSPRPNLTHGDSAILSLQHWMEGHYREQMTHGSLAVRSGMTQRTLARRFKKATGDTPLEYLQHLRLQAARTLMETTGLPLDQITWEVGYQDVSSFRRLFRERTGLSPAAYRKRFSLMVSGH